MRCRIAVWLGLAAVLAGTATATASQQQAPASTPRWAHDLQLPEQSRVEFRVPDDRKAAFSFYFSVKGDPFTFAIWHYIRTKPLWAFVAHAYDDGVEVHALDQHVAPVPLHPVVGTDHAWMNVPRDTFSAGTRIVINVDRRARLRYSAGRGVIVTVDHRWSEYVNTTRVRSATTGTAVSADLEATYAGRGHAAYAQIACYNNQYPYVAAGAGSGLLTGPGDPHEISCLDRGYTFGFSRPGARPTPRWKLSTTAVGSGFDPSRLLVTAID